MNDQTNDTTANSAPAVPAQTSPADQHPFLDHEVNAINAIKAGQPGSETAPGEDAESGDAGSVTPETPASPVPEPAPVPSETERELRERLQKAEADKHRLEGMMYMATRGRGETEREPAETPSLPPFDMAGAEKEYMDLVADGDYDKAAAKRVEINNHLRESAKAEALNNLYAEQSLSRAYMAEREFFQSAPYMQAGAEKFDQAVYNGYIDLRDDFIKAGYPEMEAVKRAAEITTKINPQPTLKGEGGQPVNPSTPPPARPAPAAPPMSLANVPSAAPSDAGNDSGISAYLRQSYDDQENQAFGMVSTPEGRMKWDRMKRQAMGLR
ncbi:MAG: hypothetical protein HQK86_08820 [Nitrospinae bacterium]|nr:hypothetical protein [Nitrospinota bacterium]MBF0634837.1 hypothetical protein [Nitrospinota bacterium]